MDDYTYFYTNVHPEEVPPGKLREAHRRRYGIETDFCVIIERSLVKCGSRNPALRAFYVNFSAHLYNIWTVANIPRVEESAQPPRGQLNWFETQSVITGTEIFDFRTTPWYSL